MNNLLDNAALDFEHAGLRVLIVADEDGWANDPRDRDNAGTIYSWTRDFDGDERISEPDLEIDMADESADEADWQVVDLPTYMRHHYDAVLTIGLRFSDYGSSGARLYVDNDDPNCCICFTQKEIDSEWPVGGVDAATKYALSRVNELDEWLQGEVYGVVVCSLDDGAKQTDIERMRENNLRRVGIYTGPEHSYRDHPEPTVYESVWGFIGDPFGATGEYMKDEGRGLAEQVRAELDREAAEAHRWACADVVTV